MYICCYPSVAVMGQPDLLAENVDELIYGDECEILEEVGAYAKIRTDYGYEGYVERKALMEPLHAPNRIVTVPFTDLLPEPKNHFRPMMTLPRGAKLDVGYSTEIPRYGVAVLPTTRGWYLHKEHVRPIPTGVGTEEELRKGIVEAALSYLGVQYRWGGRTPAGVDCSGLCFMAYRLNGLTIWRDADVDRTPRLRKISLEEAKPGDMMFFPGHVAMYLGNGEFVHSAATPGMVVRDTIANAPGLMARLSCVATYF